jgi:hypothetical protein
MSANQYVSRMGRREMHSSRAVASVLSAVAMILLALWVATEIIVAAAGWQPLLATPLSMADWAANVATNTVPPVLVAAGAVLALLGLVLILLALLPGGRTRHRIPTDRAAVIVDDDVIAASLSRVAQQQARLVPEQVSTIVGRRRIDLLIRPTSGVPVDEAGVREAVEAELARYALVPAARLSLRISGQGAVGA